MAISSQGRRLKTWGVVKKAFDEVPGVPGWCRRQESRFWDGEGVPEKEVFIGQNGKGQI